MQALTQNIGELKQKLKSEKTKTLRLQKKLSANFIMCSRKTKKQEALIKAIQPYLTPAGFEIFKTQIMNDGKKHKGRRCTNKLKIIATSVQYASPKAYRVLPDIFIMPTKETSDNYINDGVTLSPGLCEPINSAWVTK